jgi:glutathione synthase/RimK-type ligase-like ATP-grasp enzyme
MCGGTTLVILVCGVREEGPVALAIDALRRRGADFLVVDPDDLGTRVGVRWSWVEGRPTGAVAVDERVVDLHEIGGVYLRYLGDPTASGDDARTVRARGTAIALADLFDVLPARVVNRRRPMTSNNSKPYQSLLIRRAGFAVPPTLVTSVPEAARELAERYGAVIYKSASSVRSIVAPLGEDDLRRLAAIRGLATQFQAEIRGYEVRVHVVDRATFGARIRSDRTDYRYASAQGGRTVIAPMEIPRPLAERCIALARALDMAFVGIDLIVGDEEVVCLEVNPCPGYSYYQEATDTPIADALAAYLDGEAVEDA